MSITDVFIRSMSGYVFVVPGIILHFLRLKKSGKGQTPRHIATAFVFCYYLIGILTMTGIGKLYSFSPRMALIPFLDMIVEPIDDLLNVALFLPLGFFLPLLYGRYSRAGSVAKAGFLLSLTIEILQMFGRGTSDINDLITNVFGACLGHCIYRLVCKQTRRELLGEFRANQINDGVELLFFTAYVLVVMVTIQPWVLHSLFRLG